MKTNEAGVELIKSFEGLRLTSYKDATGIWTVSYGHTGPDVHPDMVVNEAAADQMLAKDLEKFEGGVAKLVKVPVNENQFSALVAFAYNVGLDNLAKSLLLKAVNSNQMDSASKQFLLWNHAGGRVLPGLTARRQAESDLFSTETPS